MKKKYLIISLLFFSVFLKGQDFGMWYEVTGVFPVKNFDFVIANILRTDDNASHVYEAYIEPEVIYNFSPYMAAGLGLDIYIEPDEPKTYLIYDLIMTAPYKHFGGQFRYRAEFNFSHGIWVSRCRLLFDYKIEKFRPYISSELFFTQYDEILPIKWEHIIGVTYKNAPSIEYARYEIVGEGGMNVLSLKYTFNF